MPPERDLLANFERMRRGMDELFGDAFERGLAPRRRAGFSPPVDVYYCGEPARAVVKVELAGVDPDRLGLEISGRELVIAGHRDASRAEGQVYQQVEIQDGPFRRVVALGADVRAQDATAAYEDGILRVELPLVEPERHRRAVPIDVRGSAEAGRS